jgi:filamentous hemagglutinin family protein
VKRVHFCCFSGKYKHTVEYRGTKMNFRVQLPMLALASFIFPVTAWAQITPDTSVGTTVTPNQLINGILSDHINGGTVRGNNLFHSFQEFNINAGRGVYFTNPTDVTNIFTRVTGANPSNINGRLGVLGEANLFFLNPKGIIFGRSASLDVKGSFLGTTASSINFADGTSFSAAKTQATGLLTVSVPVGLNLGTKPGAIEVQGSGHNLQSGISQLLSGTRGTSQLQVLPGKTLALIGGDIILNSGVISTEGGRIELAAIGNENQNPSVKLMSTPTNWDFDYSSINNFANINLMQKALIDASGVSPGNIQLAGSRINITGGSFVLLHNRGTQAPGSITVKASEILNLRDKVADSNLADSRILSYTQGPGRGGDIFIETKQLIVQDYADIANVTYGQGNSGNINIKATDSILVRGLTESKESQPVSTTIATLTQASTTNTGNAGRVTIDTRKLTILPGGTVAAANFRAGNGGNIIINASEMVELIGDNSKATGEASIAATNRSSGKAGHIEINTPKLQIQNGGAITASSNGIGDGGNITVNASDSIQLAGSRRVNTNVNTNINTNPINISSQISASVSLSTIQQASGSRAILRGTSGNITLNTPELIITDDAQVSIRNEGVGDARKLNINAGSILLNNARLSAFTNSGSGGDINLNLKDYLLMRNGSLITTEAQGTGNGGNISINSPIITQLENSNISANAANGGGGNITINTQGLFQSRDSNITASGTTDGRIEIITPDINQENSLSLQATNFVNTETVVASSCLAQQNVQQGSFVVTGNGGLPEIPYENTSLPYQLVQIQAVNTQNLADGVNKVYQNTRAWKIGDPIVEAQSLQLINGRVLLTADNSVDEFSHTSDLTCES